MGRPAVKPTTIQREQVEIMCGLGLAETDIALILGIAPKTLRKHFRDELDNGIARIKGRIAGKLFERAMAGSDSVLIFLGKTRLGLKERSIVDIGNLGEGSTSDEVRSRIDRKLAGLAAPGGAE